MYIVPSIELLYVVLSLVMFTIIYRTKSFAVAVVLAICVFIVNILAIVSINNLGEFPLIYLKYYDVQCFYVTNSTQCTTIGPNLVETIKIDLDIALLLSLIMFAFQLLTMVWVMHKIIYRESW